MNNISLIGNGYIIAPFDRIDAKKKDGIMYMKNMMKEYQNILPILLNIDFVESCDAITIEFILLIIF